MSENTKIMMRGLIKPFQNKGGSSWNLNLSTTKVSNDYINAEFLTGVSIVTDFNIDGAEVERTCSINLADNPKHGEIRKALVDKFDGSSTFNKYNTTKDNSVEVEFEFDGCTDSYKKATDTTYYNVRVKNITLV